MDLTPLSQEAAAAAAVVAAAAAVMVMSPGEWWLYLQVRQITAVMMRWRIAIISFIIITFSPCWQGRVARQREGEKGREGRIKTNPLCELVLVAMATIITSHLGEQEQEEEEEEEGREKERKKERRDGKVGDEDVKAGARMLHLKFNF